MGGVGRGLERQWGQWRRLEGRCGAFWGEDFGGGGGDRMAGLLLRRIAVVVIIIILQAPVQTGHNARDGVGEVGSGGLDIGEGRRLGQRVRVVAVVRRSRSGGRPGAGSRLGGRHAANTIRRNWEEFGLYSVLVKGPSNQVIGGEDDEVGQLCRFK